MSVPRASRAPVRAAAMARTPVPAPTSSTLSKRRDLIRSFQASRQPTVVPWWPVPKAAPASMRRATALGGTCPRSWAP